VKPYIVKKLLLTIDEAAQLTGLTEKAVRQRILKRTFPHTKMHGRVFVASDELEKFVALCSALTAEEACENFGRTA
jgi:excisionase family DNA binding protein